MLRAKHLREGTTRVIEAAAPRDSAEALRIAYLDLLKLCLCDLAGARTLSVSRTGDSRRPDAPILYRDLPEDELALRVRGADWPYAGLTMVGLERLDDLQRCLEAVVADAVPGDVIEAGVWRGGAAILARATLDSLGAADRTVWVADSFRGLPPPDRDAFPEDRDLDLSQVDFLAVPPDEVRSYFARFGLDHDIELVEGLFDRTLPELRGRNWSLVRLDGDTYEAIWVGLDSLYPSLSAGGYMVIDDYQLIEECRRAVDDYRQAHGIEEPIEKIDWNGITWRKRSEATPQAAEQPRRRDRVGSQDPEAPPRTAIPSERELELEAEIAGLRERLREAESAGRSSGLPWRRGKAR